MNPVVNAGAAVVLAISLGGEAARAAPAPGRSGAPAPNYVQLRDGARLILEARCGACHIGDYPSALPGALAIYDLSQEDWSRDMTDRQLDDAAGRLADPLGLDEVVRAPASAEDQALFGRFVAAEKARRQAASSRTTR